MKKEFVTLIEKYNKKGHFYTSYPPEVRWTKKFSHKDYIQALSSLSSVEEPLSLYVHFPFCNSKCLYCLCRTNTSIGDRQKIEEFTNHLLKEIKLLKAEFDKNSYTPVFRELHFGGGSPSMMTKEQFTTVVNHLTTIINFDTLEEFNLEIDPRTVDKEKLLFFQSMGVNRASFGIQDFDLQVQRAVNRVLSFELVQDLLSDEIRAGFGSINFDLIYGLPLQNKGTLNATIAKAISLSPDRICLYSYVHKPEIHEIQKSIKDSELPSSSEKIEMFMESRETLLKNGYKHIGIDHFAKAQDELAKALDNRTVSRNYNGYNTGRVKHLLGIGPTGSGRFANYYAQNTFSCADYYTFLYNGMFPVIKGYVMDKDDLIRRHVIDSIICNCVLDFSDVEKRFGIRFEEYFGNELKMLITLEHDGIIKLGKRMLTVTELGRIFLPPICSIFDKFFEKKDELV